MGLVLCLSTPLPINFRAPMTTAHISVCCLMLATAPRTLVVVVNLLVAQLVLVLGWYRTQ